MPDGWSTVPLRDVAYLDVQKVPVVPSAKYDLAGVLSFGRGLFQRDQLSGSATSYTYLHRLRRGQLVMSKLKAWEGALAMVTDEFDGFHLSPEFPTYTARPGVLSAWLALLARWPTFWERVSLQSRGMGGRKERVHQDRLLDVLLTSRPSPSSGASWT